MGRRARSNGGSLDGLFKPRQHWFNGSYSPIASLHASWDTVQHAREARGSEGDEGQNMYTRHDVIQPGEGRLPEAIMVTLYSVIHYQYSHPPPKAFEDTITYVTTAAIVYFGSVD